MKKTIAFSSLSFLILSCTVAHAIEIDPMRLEHSLTAGKNYSGSFKIKNSSDSSVQVLISTGGYRYIFSEGTIPPADASKKRLPSCGVWFNFEQPAVTLKPGETNEVKFIIKIPKDISTEHLCAVLFDEKPVQDISKTENRSGAGSVIMQVMPRFSIPVYISIKGTRKISAEITDITAQEPQSRKANPIVKIGLENTGNNHIRPFGTLIIFNQNGELVKNVPIGRSLPVFPGYRETIPVPCPKLQPGAYTAVATVEIEKDRIIQKKASFTLKDAVYFD